MRVAALLAAVLSMSPLPAAAQTPGTLLASEPMANAPPGARGWRVRYASTSDRGAPIEVTGFVLAPIGPPPPGGRKVMAWAHGTWGVEDQCTPSTSPSVFANTPWMRDAIARGYVIAATDYAGLGTPLPNPYLVGASVAHDMLDSVRAARAIRETGAGDRYVVWGESQGGHAALFAGEYAASYAPELKLVGVAAAAPPTDLVANLTGGKDPSIRAFMTAFTAYSWSEHFGAPLSTLGNRRTAGIITRLARNNCVSLGGKPKLGMVIGVLALRRDLRDVDLGRLQPWARIARDNSPGQRPPGGPLLIAQNTTDVIVSSEVTHAYVRKACRRGERVRYIRFATKGGHPASATDSAEQTFDWMDARFAGARPPSDCAKL